MEMCCIEMNGIHQNARNRKFEEPYPECFGRMVNLFELNIGVSANRLLNDKPHLDGSPASRRISPSCDPMEEKLLESELKKRRSDGTSMKILIAQEMSKEVESKHDQPNLVAKLMGLDALPQQEPDPAIQRSQPRGHPQNESDIPTSFWEQQNGYFHYVHLNEYKDLCEIKQQLPKSTHQERYRETINDKQMALVRQKFIEAKRLSMDEKLRQSKQFQDALETLSSNKELFLKCLQELNSVFSHPLHSRQSVTTPPETKRITVLRPSKMAESTDSAGVGNKDGKQLKKGAFLQLNGLQKIHPGCPLPKNLKCYEDPTQPTQIVVLKPSPVKTCDVKAVGSPQLEPQRISNEDFLGDVGDDKNQESREIAKEITQQMREKLGRHSRDETLISSVFSSGYVGDESSFNKSEIEHADGDLSDSEVMLPVSRQSWDYVNRLGSPYSFAFSWASCSPESVVCREAKKRLSERWAMMASSRSCQQQRHVRSSSSTLGEMLALSERKKAASPGKEGSSSEEPKDSNSLLVSEQQKEENMDNAPRNLMRSKSVPVFCTEFENRLNEGNSVSDKGKPESSKEDTKARSVTSSFRGKVSSLLSSRNRKPGKDKPLVAKTKDEFHSFPAELCSDITESLSYEGSNHASPRLLELSSKASSSCLIGKESMIFPETGKPVASGNPGENQGQPSPISVLDPPSEEDEHTAALFPLYVKFDQQGAGLPLNSIGSNLIDKSPPIGSIARTLSWNDSYVKTASSDPTGKSLTTQEREDEEQERFFFVKTLLSVAGLQCEVKSNSFLARWHSPESPLDPSLRDKYVDLKDMETLHEARRKQKRSIRKLIFDCVNAELVEIAGYGLDGGQRTVPCFRANNCTSENASSGMVNEVWARMNLLFSGEPRRVSDDCGDDNSLVVERVARKEVVGKGWDDCMRLEMDHLGKDIEGKLVEELVQEAVVELTALWTQGIDWLAIQHSHSLGGRLEFFGVIDVKDFGRTLITCLTFSSLFMFLKSNRNSSSD
ncbi:hypothetical protein CDL12_26660 [Handroanthus impetiginosus]|uniref:DUF3741 domain-containing protein n=1 Tax=Handroanthus impetiginosus TaxID=429701 RepID=A0A2G9G6B0_9LAMI|nr:hypothetical protein CDL12_26660 [Handroanthus impetiginosus]